MKKCETCKLTDDIWSLGFRVQGAGFRILAVEESKMGSAIIFHSLRITKKKSRTPQLMV